MNDSLTSVGGWIWEASWQAAVLVILVLLAQRVFRRWLTPEWRYALWALVVVRLLMPVLPESSFSIFNVVGEKPVEELARAPKQEVQPEPISPTPLVAEPEPEQKRELKRLMPAPQPPPVTPTPPVAEVKVVVEAPPVTTPVNWPAVASMVWLIGFLVVGGVMTFSYWRMRRKIVGLPRVTDARLQRLLKEALQDVGVKRAVILVESYPELGPALFGFLRPRLVLPKGLAEEFSDAELRHVLLHECAHLRRHDLGLNWLAALLQAAHWFNPILWFAFARMRADREFACDDLALRVAGESDSTAYGGTIVRLLERATNGGLLPGMVGIVEKQSDIKQRISLIAAFR